MIPLPILAYLLFLVVGVGSFAIRLVWRRSLVSEREYRIWDAWYYIFEIGQAVWAIGLILWLHA